MSVATATEIFFGHNYAIQVEGRGPIKIGFTTRSAQHRLAALQQASPYRLSLLAEWSATEADEKQIHLLLSPYRLRAEWYHPVSPVHEAIEAAIKTSADREPQRLAFMARWNGTHADLRPDLYPVEQERV